MKKEVAIPNLVGWLFGIIVLTIGLSNLFLVHPVPAIVFLLLSLIYLPPVTELIQQRTGFSIHPAIKIILGVVIIWFTLGVSDLGDIIDG